MQKQYPVMADVLDVLHVEILKVPWQKAACLILNVRRKGGPMVM